MASAAARRLFRPFLASDFAKMPAEEHAKLYQTALLFHLHPTRDLNIPPPPLSLSTRSSSSSLAMIERERGRRYMIDMANRILSKRAGEERRRMKEATNERKVAHRHGKAGPVLRAQEKLDRAQRLGSNQTHAEEDDEDQAKKKEKLPLGMLTMSERFEYEEARHKTIQELVNGMDERIRLWREKRRQARLQQKQGQLPF